MGISAHVLFRFLCGGLGKDFEVHIARSEGCLAYVELFVAEKATHNAVFAEKAAPPAEDQPFTKADASAERSAF